MQLIKEEVSLCFIYSNLWLTNTVIGLNDITESICFSNDVYYTTLWYKTFPLLQLVVAAHQNVM